MEKNIAVVDGDARQQALCSILRQQGMTAELIFLSDESVLPDLKLLADCRLLVLPVPTTRDGSTLNAPQLKAPLLLTRLLSALPAGATVFTGGAVPEAEAFKSLNFCDLLQQEPLVLKNALATAEAALAILIQTMPQTLFQSSILLLGYGRIAKFLAKYLQCLGAHVTVAARSEAARTAAETQGLRAVSFPEAEIHLNCFHAVVNTVPQPVLLQEQLLKLNQSCFLLDLASKPGGFDYDAARVLRLHTLQALSLPGKYSPFSAAAFMAEAIAQKRKELSET